VGKTIIINHPPVITINKWYKPFPVMAGLWPCFTHINHINLVNVYPRALPGFPSNASWLLTPFARRASGFTMGNTTDIAMV